MSKFLDLTGLGKLVENVKGELDTKVDKVTGKGLSANDFTDAYKNKLDGIAEGANKYTHPDSGVAVGTYRSVTVNKQGHVTAGTNPTTLEGYGITEVEAEKITGTINIANLPQGALERCVVVADDEARFKLTTANVQVGDTVKVVSSGVMYFVEDDTKLSEEGGYEIYTAGSATSAFSDSKGQNIASTYIKDVSLMGMSAVVGTDDNMSDAGYEYLKITKGDNSTSDIKFNTFTTDKNGLVPAPLASTSAKFLRDDGTWVAPNFLSLDGGTMAGDIDMNNYNITGAMNIIAHGNIATDGIIATNGGKINTAGGDINTLSGNINTLGGDIFLGVTNKDTKGSISGVDTVTANSFIGNLQGNATSASSVPWSGVTDIEYATEEDILSLFD